MGTEKSEPGWHINWLGPGLLLNKPAIRPAEIGDGLCKIMLAHKNVLEDANYIKIVPNRYVVEISPETYLDQYKPLDTQLIEQWRERLREHLLITNSRLGRKEYRFSGQLQIDLRPAGDIRNNSARILSRVEPDDEERRMQQNSKSRGAEAAFLELVNGNRQWPLYSGNNILGRDETCDVYLDLPVIQEKRLISAQHAWIRIENGRYYLYDGAPSGKPSANGTFINSQRIQGGGALIQDGDIITLAAFDPQSPRWDTPGVAILRFRVANPNAG